MSFLYSCKDVTNVASKMEEGKLSLFNRLRFRVHLFICDACKNFIAQYDQLKTAIKQSTPDLKLNDDAKQAIIERIRQIEN